MLLQFIMMEFNLKQAQWQNKPTKFSIGDNSVTVTTEPNTDFWQRTYYGFKNDNAHLLYNTTDEKYFSFTIKVAFEYKALFDQCGIGMYQDSDHWAKCGIEYHNDKTMWLGSVVTNHGYSDWATQDIGTDLKAIWYRLNRRESDFLFEYSLDGLDFKQMRIFHLHKGSDKINFGLLACSPSSSTFEAVFSDFKMGKSLWKEHKKTAPLLV